MKNEQLTMNFGVQPVPDDPRIFNRPGNTKAISEFFDEAAKGAKATQIDAKKIEAELQELAGEIPVKVKLNNHLDVATSTKETDKGFFITFNPKRFSPKKLEEHLNMCREAVTWGS